VVEGYSFEDTRVWVERLSRTIGQVVPELVSWKWEVKARGGLARLDYTQNAINKTLVAPYSPRPATGAPVSVPISWDELEDPDVRPDRWTIRTVLDRLATHGDPFRALLGAAQELPELR
jgi:bifunctional non-homologous end joining protein LigD